MTNTRSFWNAYSDDYQAEHGATLRDTAMAWGVWRIPESELNVLGEVSHRDVLELGCGAAQWTIALRAKGARVVGIDLSGQQLHHARLAAQATGTDVPLVEGDAERLPFREASFDVVFCDHGAIVFADPEKTLAEAARVLRPGGLGVFCMSTPIRDICIDPATGAVQPVLSASYFDLSRHDAGDVAEYQRPYGAWIRLFRRHGLVVDDLIELQPPPRATTTYADYVPVSWAQRWPAEHIWKVTRYSPA